jgi:hypothetical protein
VWLEMLVPFLAIGMNYHHGKNRHSEPRTSCLGLMTIVIGARGGVVWGAAGDYARASSTRSAFTLSANVLASPGTCLSPPTAFFQSTTKANVSRPIVPATEFSSVDLQPSQLDAPTAPAGHNHRGVTHTSAKSYQECRSHILD